LHKLDNDQTVASGKVAVMIFSSARRPPVEARND